MRKIYERFWGVGNFLAPRASSFMFLHSPRVSLLISDLALRVTQGLIARTVAPGSISLNYSFPIIVVFTRLAGATPLAIRNLSSTCSSPYTCAEFDEQVLTAAVNKLDITDERQLHPTLLVSCALV